MNGSHRTREHDSRDRSGNGRWLQPHEVTLALGLLATVRLHRSLFIIGGKQVHQGKSTTSATAVATIGALTSSYVEHSGIPAASIQAP
jgi:hypothetical protein